MARLLIFINLFTVLTKIIQHFDILVSCLFEEPNQQRLFQRILGPEEDIFHSGNIRFYLTLLFS